MAKKIEIVFTHGKSVNRRQFMEKGVAGVAAATFFPAIARSEANLGKVPDVKEFELEETTIPELQEGVKAGKWSEVSIVEKYLDQIEALDKKGPGLNSVIEINPDAQRIAAELDKERKEKGPRGPLHGIPVLIKDNIATADRMMTTAGSLALVGSKPPQDAFLAERLRKAGAIILGKTNLSEWANFRSSHSTSGWSGRGGQTRNPYALDRNPCGSSSGSGAAVSANLCAVAIGTETDGSVVCPSSANSVVGLKPTVGLISRAGVVPISHSQDTAGPMARTVRDAAILLGALTGIDSEDKATAGSHGKALPDYTKFLDRDGLRGARIGVVRKLVGTHNAVVRLFNSALDALRSQGAVLVDPTEIATLGKFEKSEFDVLLYEFKSDLNSYLHGLGPGAPVHTLAEIIQFNSRNREKEMPYFGQDIFEKAQAKGPLTDKAYLDALEKDHRLSRTEGIDAVMDKLKLDALVAPTAGPAWVIDLVNGDHDTGGSSTPAAVAGYPDITVPAGFIFGLPVGISFFGRAWSEPTLLKLAYAFEQTTQARKPPAFLPTANLEA